MTSLVHAERLARLDFTVPTGSEVTQDSIDLVFASDPSNPWVQQYVDPATIRITRVPGQGWAVYGKIVGVFETRARAREFAEAIKAREREAEGVTEYDSWTGWPLGKPNPG